jgi:4,5-dihydroxyphthalate decarboxylase
MNQTNLRAAVGAKHWRGALATAMPELQFEDIEPIHRAFAPMAREQVFDVSEMAIVTALQALGYGKPIVLLPVTFAARFQHGCLVARRQDPPLTAADLRGRRVAVRAYTQTTGVWVRGILENDEGVPASSITWLTQEEAHVAEYEDPPWVEHVGPEISLMKLLREGAVDAAIWGNDLPDDPDLLPLFPDAKAAARTWHARHHIVPVNHVMVVRADAPADSVRGLWEVLRRIRPQQSGDVDMAPFGTDALRPVLEILLTYCAQQQLLPRALSVDEVFADATRILGEAARR